VDGSKIVLTCVLLSCGKSDHQQKETLTFEDMSEKLWQKNNEKPNFQIMLLSKAT
jgi:hypothetical protein